MTRKKGSRHKDTMKHLLTHISAVHKRLHDKDVVLFLDYDGTLAPIVLHPAKARTPPGVKSMIEAFMQKDRCRIAIISGRSLGDIKEKVGINGIMYVGNHGLEIEGPKLKFESPVSLRYRTILNNIKSSLESKLAEVKGVFIEDKGLSLGVHFREVEDTQEALVKTAFHETAIVYLVRDKIKIKTGKKVLEIRPPTAWDKGKVVLWLLARWNYSQRHNQVPIYIGDDSTDEDAFKVLRHLGVTVRVAAARNSCAEYFLNTTQEVRTFLRMLLGWC